MADRQRDAVTWWPGGLHHLGQLVDEHDWVCLEGDERDPDRPHPVFLRLGRSPEGRLVCTGLIVGNLARFHGSPVEITARSLRSIPLAELIGTAVSTGRLPDDFGAEIRKLLHDAPGLPARLKVRPGPKGHSAEHFAHVADMYRLALDKAPGAPMRWLRKELHVSEATARRWVQRARDQGLLGPSVPGKAGEGER